MHGKPYTYKEFYVIQWANYIINNEDWSTMQTKLINSQINNAKKINLTKKQVNELKAVDSERLKREEEIGWMMLSEQSLKEVWNNPIDKRWDEIL